MRRFVLPIVSAVVLTIAAQSRAGAAAAPNGYGVPMLNGYDIDAASRVLDTISSPTRRDKLAEDWLQFAKESVNRSLDLNQQWINVQKMQVQSQAESDQLRTEMVKMQMEIERLRNENLALESENLKARLQLQQQTGQTPNAPTSKPPQSP
jgi:hypothetical protein